MRRATREQGITLLELLISMGILVVVLGVVGVYFGRHAELNRRTQARSEVQDKVRLVMTMINQDLQLAGASRYVIDGAVFANPVITICPLDVTTATVNTCLWSDDSTSQDLLSLVYISSRFTQADACRRVGYRFNGGVLLRADEICDAGQTLLDPADGLDQALYSELADNILAVDVQYQCSNGNALTGFPDTVNCPTNTGYPRSAVVTVVARSNEPIADIAAETITTVTGQDVNCPQDFLCASLTQEVFLPNMKGNN